MTSQPIFPRPLSRIALTNGVIILNDRVVSGQTIIIADGKIIGLTTSSIFDSDTEVVDTGGRFISPGLIDIHTHGALNHTFNEPTSQAFETITTANAARGITGMLATLAAAPLPALQKSLAFIQSWKANQIQPTGSAIFGAHLESPYINLAQKGALDPASLRNPSDGSFEELMDYASILKIFVLAPELPGSLILVDRLVKAGIIAAAGHSSAKEEQILPAIQAGLSHVTHIWSAMSTVVREGPWRKPGLLEVALTHPALTVEMIADNKHLPTTLMKLAYQSIGSKRLVAISDATSGAALPQGSHFRMGEMEYEVIDGVGMMFDRSAFAGSATLLNQMIPVLCDAAGIPLPQAIEMVTRTPAKILSMENQKASLAPGFDADIAVFNSDFSAWRTMIGGHWVYIQS